MDLVQVFTVTAKSTLNLKKSYLTQAGLDNLAKTEPLWWIKSLRILDGRSLQLQEPHLVLQTDASTKNWGVHCSRVSTEGILSSDEQVFHINVL